MSKKDVKTVVIGVIVVLIALRIFSHTGIRYLFLYIWMLWGGYNDTGSIVVWPVIGNVSSIFTIVGFISLILAFKAFISNTQKKELSIYPYNNKSFIIWNSGSEPIFRRDIANKKLLGVTIKNDTEIKDIDVLEVENSPMELEKKLDPRNPNRIVFDFDFIDKGQGFVVKIPYDIYNTNPFDCKVIGGEFQYREDYCKKKKGKKKIIKGGKDKVDSIWDRFVNQIGVYFFILLVTLVVLYFYCWILTGSPVDMSSTNTSSSPASLLIPIILISGIFITFHFIKEYNLRTREIPKELISLVEPRTQAKKSKLQMWFIKQWYRFHQSKLGMWLNRQWDRSRQRY